MTGADDERDQGRASRLPGKKPKAGDTVELFARAARPDAGPPGGPPPAPPPPPPPAPPPAPPAPPPPPPPAAAAAPPASLLLVLEKGVRRRHVFLVPGHTIALGRERGNAVVLRAFQRDGTLDAGETNKISRRHLTLALDEKVASVRDERTAFQTTAGPRGKATPLEPGVARELPGEFEIGFAVGAIRVKGRVLKDEQGRVGCVRLTRPDEEASHTYLCIRTAATLGGSDLADALVLDGVPEGAARLEADADGRIALRAGAEGVSLADAPVRPGEAVPLRPGLLVLGALWITVREYSDDDFLQPAWLARGGG